MLRRFIRDFVGVRFQPWKSFVIFILTHLMLYVHFFTYDGERKPSRKLQPTISILRNRKVGCSLISNFVYDLDMSWLCYCTDVGIPNLMSTDPSLIPRVCDTHVLWSCFCHEKLAWIEQSTCILIRYISPCVLRAP